MAGRTNTKRHRNGWLAEPKRRRRGGWTPERRARQAEMIRTWQPWTRSTGPQTPAGKMRTRLNAQTHGFRGERGRVFYAALREQRKLLRSIARLAAFLDSSCHPEGGLSAVALAKAEARRISLGNESGILRCAQDDRYGLSPSPGSENLQNPVSCHMVPPTGEKPVKMLSSMQKTFIAAGLAVTSVFAVAAQGSAQEAPQNYGFAEVPACSTPKNQRVQFQYYSTPEFVKTRGFLAAANRLRDEDRTPVVFIDRDNLPFYPQEFQNFILLHECAHHENDDLNKYPEGVPTERVLQQIEEQADCTAVLRLRDEKKYGDREFGIVARNLASVMQKTNAANREIRTRLGAMNRCLLPVNP